MTANRNIYNNLPRAGDASCLPGELKAFVCTDLSWEANLRRKHKRYITNKCASHTEEAERRDERAEMTHVQIHDVAFN